MKFAFLIDPLENLKPHKDTSLALIKECIQQGIETFIFTNQDIHLKQNTLFLNITKIEFNNNKFEKKEFSTINSIDLQAIFIRTDPPFNDDYLTNTWLFDLIADKVFIMNSPTGIRNVSEKIWLNQFPQLITPTLITKNINEYNNFIKEHNKIIIKPTDNYSGNGIFLVEKNTPNVNVTFETLSNAGSKYVIIQKYVEEAQIGDKRILLLNGNFLGAVLRVHPPNDHRNNFAVGGKPVPTIITKRDQEIIDTLKPYLLKKGLYFVGIDILGEYLTEVNVTSPTCLLEMNTIYNKTLETDVINFVKEMIKK